MKFFEDKKYVEKYIIPSIREMEGGRDTLLQKVAREIHRTINCTEEESKKYARQHIYHNTDIPHHGYLTQDTQQQIEHLRRKWEHKGEIGNLMLAFPKHIQGKRSLPEDEVARKKQNKEFMKSFTGSEMTQEEEKEVLREITRYEDLHSCDCMKRRNPDNVDIYHEDDTPKIIHDFLHKTCKDKLLAVIVFNGHGDCNHTTCKNDESKCKKTCKKGKCSCTSSMSFQTGKNVPLNKILYDVWKCFDAIAPQSPPYWIRVYFAQCFGDGYDENFSMESMKAVHVIKRHRGSRKTVDRNDHHIELEILAEELRSAQNLGAKAKGILAPRD